MQACFIPTCFQTCPICEVFVTSPCIDVIKSWFFFFCFVYIEAISCLWSSQQRQTCKLLVCLGGTLGAVNYFILFYFIYIYFFCILIDGVIFSVALMHAATFLYCMDLDFHLVIAGICSSRIITYGCALYWCSVLYLWTGEGLLPQLIYISFIFLV